MCIYTKRHLVKWYIYIYIWILQLYTCRLSYFDSLFNMSLSNVTSVKTCSFAMSIKSISMKDSFDSAQMRCNVLWNSSSVVRYMLILSAYLRIRHRNNFACRTDTLLFSTVTVSASTWSRRMMFWLCFMRETAFLWLLSCVFMKDIRTHESMRQCFIYDRLERINIVFVRSA